MVKTPFNDEVGTSAADPFNLATGSGSQMFGNEKRSDENVRKKQLEAKRAQQQSELLPVANDLLEELNRLKAANADIRSYIKASGAQKVSKETILTEFKAREMNIALIEEIEGWIRNRLRRQT